MEKELKKCKNCNEAILKGRSDKIFCATACHNEYHNKNGLRKQLYEFYQENKEQLLNYIDARIEVFTSEKLKIMRKLDKMDSNSYLNVEYQHQLLKLHKDLSQLQKMKRSIPFE
ncbi:hypothetical protein MWU58_01015 [Flavobacteriaceae bacterium S0825]|uniref:hypothetical protein n=1 Tax=Gaetbulibacter sp. S0825 TaxID=2720084 RepID=UPI001431C2AA|nr:hypothetical protein [Gaetbulibacter sp. S0825]MCK0107861.1 hypothetical protein [Flavobacteriaceae bacterium S0825]NIX63497.1 hypothetical protein [Gaetbulibacter sp. S0825]